nr:RNA-directed DNA polymerase, eukaryota [Tanacetum cinerariifolium]
MKSKNHSTTESPKAPRGDSETLSKLPGYENFKHQNKHNSQHSSSSCPGAKSSRASKPLSKAFSNHGSMIEALVSQIEMGKVLGYDMEGRTNDLKKLIEGIRAKHETHSLSIDPFKVKSLWGNFQFDFAICPSVGRSGGLLSVWDTNSFSNINVFAFDHFLIVEGNWLHSHLHCFMVNVYAPQDDRNKKIIWNSILEFKEEHSGHYIIFGDFNVVRFASERIGTMFNSSSANAFNQFIINGSPIILTAATVDFGPSPFKLYNSWLLDSWLESLHNIEREEQLDISQQAKVKWVIEANENTKFFHATVFVKHRQILDGPLMVNEVIKWCNRKRDKLMIFKIDFEKAFDSVSWDFLFQDFLFQVMHFMGFSDKWISWINGCLSHATASILVNGSPTREYHINRGLRQGDPLSPFLFIIAMEGLHVAVEDAISAGLYRGIKINTLTLSHFFFADDALFIGEWPRDNIRNMTTILEYFHIVFGLKINFHKSNLVGIGIPFEEVKILSQITGCHASHSSFTYLGLPVGCNMAVTKSWDPLIYKFSKHLSTWKASLLSIGGMTILLTSVLGTIGDSSLKTKFSRIYRLASNQDCVVRDCWNNGWVFSWSRPILRVKCAREHIDNCYLPDGGSETIWNHFLQKKINIFIWRALRDRLPTRWNLSRKGIDLDTLSCPIYDSSIETSNHTLWFCSLATSIWYKVFAWLDIDTPCHAHIQDIYEKQTVIFYIFVVFSLENRRKLVAMKVANEFDVMAIKWRMTYRIGEWHSQLHRLLLESIVFGPALMSETLQYWPRDGKGVLGIGRERGGRKKVKNKDAYVSNEAGTVGKHVAGSSLMSNNDIVSGNKQDISSIAANIHDIKRQMLEGKFVLVGDDVKEHFENFVYGFSVGKRVVYQMVENYVKNAWSRFGRDGLSSIATKHGTALILDTYTTLMCMESWGQSSFAKARIDLRADVE